ncbi:hypothetical protein [Sinomonas sp. ASV322]|uniref:hypothetical protein n=1 Tax=Sinomonas sp. ASV322 TaxID=3041920 RepID=UPI0027DD4949|nr:hypothetical protein [Sinomonas sp. ASV322]MDQ4504524.1 hypothetical protein [Sinomonas sp. ASV322]
MAEPWENVLGRLEADLDAVDRHLAAAGGPGAGRPGAGESAAAGGPGAGWPAAGRPAAAGESAAAGWAPPSSVGPIPERLVGRALAVQERQGTLAARLAEAKDDAARHLAAVSSVPLGRREGALYLDVEG